MTEFFLGAIAMAFFVAGLFFMRFWKSTQDRFFMYFGVAFWIEAVNRTFLAFEDPTSEHLPIFYLIRLLAFGLIIFAILDKNCMQKRP